MHIVYYKPLTKIVPAMTGRNIQRDNPGIAGHSGEEPALAVRVACGSEPTHQVAKTPPIGRTQILFPDAPTVCSLPEFVSLGVHATAKLGRAAGPVEQPRRAEPGEKRAVRRRLRTVDDSIHRAAIVSQGVGQRRSNWVNFRKKVASVASSTSRPATNWRMKLGCQLPSAKSED